MKSAAAATAAFTLMSVLVKLGEPTQARDLLRHVVDLRFRILGEDDPKTLKSLELLTSILIWTKEIAEARVLAASLVEKRTRLVGADHADTVKARELLAEVDSGGDSPVTS
jgi:hypothetical protein